LRNLELEWRMASLSITYRIKLSKKITEVFEFQLDDQTGDLVLEAPVNPPAWTALEYQQCSHCPLNKTEQPYCPIALQLNNFLERFHDTSSIDEVEMEVITEERRVLQTVPLQRAIASMLGLVAPTCGCPKAAYMKPMARFHLPLSTEEETLFRVTGMFLLAHHLMEKNTRIKTPANFSGLKAIYEELHIVNRAIASRLRGTTVSDSAKNAIALLDMYTNLMPMMIEDHLPALSDLFSAYYAGPLPVSKPASAGLSLSLMDIEVAADTDSAVAPQENPKKTEVKKEEVKKPETIKDKELEDLLNQKEFVSELELLLAPDEAPPVIKTTSTAAPDKSKGRAIFKISDD